MKALCLLISLAALVAFAACGQDGSQAASVGLFDEKIPQLCNGASVEEVEDRLGDPRNRAVLEKGEVALYYGLWQLFFEPGLTVRVRYYKAGYWPPGQPVGELDREVRKLESRISLATAEHQLGKPESWQIEVPKKTEDLWYGPGRWKLVFSHGSLVRKILYAGGSASRSYS